MVTPVRICGHRGHGHNLTTLPDSGPQGPIVLRAARLAQIRADVIGYNVVIAIQAAINGATLVDIWTLVNNLAANGVEVNGQKLTTSFGGGLFSLDGVHPTNTGYAIIANEFIKTMNRSLQTGIPPIFGGTGRQNRSALPEQWPRTQRARQCGNGRWPARPGQTVASHSSSGGFGGLPLRSEPPAGPRGSTMRFRGVPVYGRGRCTRVSSCPCRRRPGSRGLRWKTR